MKVNWNLVVDVVVALVGVYVLMNGIWMKSTGKTSSLLATPEELKKCKHPEKIREEVTPKMLLCGALALVYGIVTALVRPSLNCRLLLNQESFCCWCYPVCFWSVH